MVISHRTRNAAETFLKRLFARGELYQQLFDNLWEEGCNAEHLAELFFAVCTIAVHDHGRMLAVGDISNSELRQLPKRLCSIANLVERVNKTGLSPKIDLLASALDPQRNEARKHAASLYAMLPGIMRVYSCHLERFVKFRRTLLKRLTLTQVITLDLLLYIRKCTGGPKYDAISNLLTSGFLVAGGHEADIPKCFSAEALSKLKQRRAKLR